MTKTPMWYGVHPLLRHEGCVGHPTIPQPRANTTTQPSLPRSRQSTGLLVILQR